MNLNCKKIFFLFILCLSQGLLFSKRSNFRPYDGSPIITTNWVGKETIYHLEDSHLEIFPLSTFDEDYFFTHMLPEDPIPFRYYPDKNFDPEIIKTALNKFFYEIRRQQKRFTDFEILKKDGFNIKKQAGLLVVKGKEWPLNQFVVKLFMETPRSFIRAYNKGFVAACHFIIGHGSTQYMLGFTRLKNLELIHRILKSHPFWNERVDAPRKWFWLPKKYPWIKFSGYNMSGKTFFELEAPGAYAIVEDAIRIKREFSIKNPQECRLGVELCNVLDCQVDPHSNNFVLEDLEGIPENHPIKQKLAQLNPDETNLTPIQLMAKKLIENHNSRIVIIDTEHLPTMVGLKKPFKIESYRHWYTYLIFNAAGKYFGKSRPYRSELYSKPTPPYQGPKEFLSPEITIATLD